jgi:zinc transporter ZupT
MSVKKKLLILAVIVIVAAILGYMLGYAFITGIF